MTIKELRKMSGFTQAEFAEYFKVSLDAVKSWESNPESNRYRKCPDSTLALLEVAVRKFLVYGSYRTYFNTETHKVLTTDQDLIYPYIVVDKDMSYVMRVLCEKGYITAGSNAGEWTYDTEVNGDDAPAVVEWPALSFEENIHIPSVPEGWSLTEEDTNFDEDENPYDTYQAWICASSFPHNTESEFTLGKLKAIINLIEWADALEPMR